MTDSTSRFITIGLSKSIFLQTMTIITQAGYNQIYDLFNIKILIVPRGAQKITQTAPRNLYSSSVNTRCSISVMHVDTQAHTEATATMSEGYDGCNW